MTAKVEVVCPACGGLVEGDDLDDLVVLAKEHTRDAHGYEIPTEHVHAAAVDVPDSQVDRG